MATLHLTKALLRLTDSGIRDLNSFISIYAGKIDTAEQKKAALQLGMLLSHKTALDSAIKVGGIPYQMLEDQAEDILEILTIIEEMKQEVGER